MRLAVGISMHSSVGVVTARIGSPSRVPDTASRDFRSSLAMRHWEKARLLDGNRIAGDLACYYQVKTGQHPLSLVAAYLADVWYVAVQNSCLLLSMRVSGFGQAQNNLWLFIPSSKMLLGKLLHQFLTVALNLSL